LFPDSFFGENYDVLLPYHPNVVDMPCAFVDRIPLLKGGMQLYPTALPPRLNPEGEISKIQRKNILLFMTHLFII